MARRQSEELHQGSCLPQAPGILGNGSRTYTNSKASEQPYPYSLALLANCNLGSPHTLTPRRTHPPPSTLTLCLGIIPPENVLCRWRLAVHLTAFVGASMHFHGLPPDLRLPFSVSGLGLGLCSL